MATIVKRVVGALLALVGLALTAVGVWFAAQLGTSGTAEFEVHPATADPVVIGPDVLNRVDADVVVTATPTTGGSMWMALANPSDADAVVGDSKHLAVTGVTVSDWSLDTATTGTGTSPELGAADLWRQQDEAKGPVTLTVKQSGAPETLVVKAQGGQLSTLTLKVTDKSWFVEAVVAALIGLFLLVAGVVLLTARRRHHGAVTVPPVPAAPGQPGEPGGTSDPDLAVGAGDGADQTAPLGTTVRSPRPDTDVPDTDVPHADGSPTPMCRTPTPRTPTDPPTPTQPTHRPDRPPRPPGGHPMTPRPDTTSRPSTTARTVGRLAASTTLLGALVLAGCGTQDALVGLQAAPVEKTTAAPLDAEGATAIAARLLAAKDAAAAADPKDPKAAEAARAEVLTGDALILAKAEAARADLLRRDHRARPRADADDRGPVAGPPVAARHPRLDARRGHQHPVAARHDLHHARRAVPHRGERPDVRWCRAARARREAGRCAAAQDRRQERPAGLPGRRPQGLRRGRRPAEGQGHRRRR